MTSRAAPPPPRRLVPSFEPRVHMTRWYNPDVAFRAGSRAAVLRTGYYDTTLLREKQLTQRYFSDYRQDPLTVDFTADLGDAFDPTMAVAWHLGRQSLDLDGQAWPRGDILILGGDLAYPWGSDERYLNQTVGPLACGFEHGGPPADLFPLPGNHDWMDGLASFHRSFSARWVGGWRSRPERSYWAIQLPSRNTWLWGLDPQGLLSADTEEIQFFRLLVHRRFNGGDRIVICLPLAVWAQQEPAMRQEVYAVLRDILKPKDARVVLFLAGGFHHYSRYAQLPDGESDGDEVGCQYVTCGGGGAFTHTTHNLAGVIPAEQGLEVGWGAAGSWADLELRRRYPSADQSRRMTGPELALAAGGRVDLFRAGASATSVALAWLLAAARRDAYAELALHDALGGDATHLIGTFGDALARRPSAGVVLAAVEAVSTAFSRTSHDSRLSSSQRTHLGALHGVGQAGLALANAAGGASIARAVARRLPGRAQRPASTLLGLTAAGGLGYALPTSLVGLFLWLSNRNGRLHWNEASAAARSRSYKSFVRLRVHHNGLIEGRVIGIDEASPGWLELGKDAALTGIPIDAKPLDQVEFRVVDRFTIPGRA